MPKLLLTSALLALLITPFNLAAAADYQKEMSDIFQMLNDKKHQEARAALGKILETNPEDPLALNNLAYSWAAEKDCAKALGLLKQAQQKAKGVKVHNIVTNMVTECRRLGLFIACQPVKEQAQAVDLEEVIKRNIASAQDMMKPLPK